MQESVPLSADFPGINITQPTGILACSNSNKQWRCAEPRAGWLRPTPGASAIGAAPSPALQSCAAGALRCGMRSRAAPIPHRSGALPACQTSSYVRITSPTYGVCLCWAVQLDRVPLGAGDEWPGQLPGLRQRRGRR